MDGEAESVDAQSVDDHLAGCAQCRAWQQQALQATRTIRVRPAVPTPDLTAAILAAAAAGRTDPAAPAQARAPGQLWRWLLGFTAFVQINLALSELLGVSHMGMTLSRDSEHLFNESTAWNLALGIGFAVAAARPRWAAGLLPTLGVFLAVLAAVSVVDVVDGNADLTRVGSHVVVLIGMVLLVMVHRVHDRGPERQQRNAGGSQSLGEAPAESMPDLRAGGGAAQRRGLRPAGRHAA